MALTVRCPKCGRLSTLTNDLKIKNGKYHCLNKYCELSKDGEIDIEKLLSVDKDIEKIDKKNLFAKYTEAFVMLMIFSVV